MVDHYLFNNEGSEDERAEEEEEENALALQTGQVSKNNLCHEACLTQFY